MTDAERWNDAYMRRTPPLNTGKVRIGVAYVPPPMPIRSMDAIKLQSALLDRRTEQPTHPIRKLLAPVWRWL